MQSWRFERIYELFGQKKYKHIHTLGGYGMPLDHGITDEVSYLGAIGTDAGELIGH